MYGYIHSTSISCLYHLLRKSAKYTQNNPKLIFSCFIDLRKAFDKVRHDGLLYKLRKNGISDLFYNIIKNMYQKTESCVKTDRSNVTDSFSSNIGVRQGVNLSPNLFKLFINDLPEIVVQTCNPVTLNSLKLNCYYMLMTLFSSLKLQKDYKTVWIKYLSTVKKNGV